MADLKTARERMVQAQIAARGNCDRALRATMLSARETFPHAFGAVLPIQFDEYVRFAGTHAVPPVTDDDAGRLPRTHPFAPYGRA